MQGFIVLFSIAATILLGTTGGSGDFDVAANFEQEKFMPRVYLAQQCAERDCDFALLDAIVWCESKWKMVDNPISTAHGFFQILDGTEATTPQHSEGKSKYVPKENIDMGVFLYERDGVNPWITSRACWHWRSQWKNDVDECVGIECDS